MSLGPVSMSRYCNAWGIVVDSRAWVTGMHWLHDYYWTKAKRTENLVASSTMHLPSWYNCEKISSASFSMLFLKRSNEMNNMEQSEICP